MNRIEYKDWLIIADIGTIEDALNPAFILSQTDVNLLYKIARGEINLQELAKRELESKGLDVNGKWVGFGKEIK